MSLRIQVKWQSKIFEDVPVNLSNSLDSLKKDLWTLTGIRPDRQMLMFKGLIKDSSDLIKMNLKDGDKILLLGTPECSEFRNDLKEEIVFIEDLNDQEKRKLLREKNMEILPIGFFNLGCTCYLNSVLQFLSPAKEFSDIVKSFCCKIIGGVDSDEHFYNMNNRLYFYLCLALKGFYIEWENADAPLVPSIILTKLGETFPQYARVNPTGFGYMQQDCEECLSRILTVYSSKTKGITIDDLFSFKIRSKIKNLETDEEEIQEEKHSKLCCLTGSQLSLVNNIDEGIKLFLNTQIEKHSVLLNKNCIYNKSSYVHTLPKYLIVHFARFEWKKANNSSGTQAGRAKVCRRILFMKTFDIFQFCSEELKKELSIGRAILANREDSKISKYIQSLKPEGDLVQCQDGKNNKIEHASEAENKEETMNIQLHTGFYTLQSIITHQGRNAESGHYVCWTNRSQIAGQTCPTEKDDIWYKIDDERVSTHSWKNIDLCGGRSDYHIAFLNLYKKDYIYATQDEYEKHKST